MSISDLPKEVFHSLLPGSEGHRKLQFFISFYLIDPLSVSIELHLKKEEVQPARLGQGNWGCLGLDTWLFPEFESTLAPVRFSINHH